MARGQSQALVSGAKQQDESQQVETGDGEVPLNHEEEFSAQVTKSWNRLPRES